jgi:ankyrin repeat protein
MAQTALHFAVMWSDIETVKLLLEHGADVHIKDSNGVQKNKTSNSLQ